MILRGAGRAIAGLALVAAVSACDDNPLSENRDSAEYFRLSVSNAVVEVGGQIGVVANVLNQYGAALVVNVTASECDAGVTVAVDTVRSEYEYPERFIITGNTVGESCVVVSGGGITDTIDVRVVPAAVDLELSAPGDTLVESGSVVDLSVAYLGATGAAAPGATLDTNTSFSVSPSAVGVVDDTGAFSARAPGTAWVKATYTYLGVTRTDSVQITVVPAAFTGTVQQVTVQGGEALLFTAGAIPFDDDTAVQFETDWGTMVTLQPVSATEAYALLPFGLPSGTTLSYSIVNAGPNQLAIGDEYTLTAATPADDSYGDTFATTPVITIGEDVFGALGADGDEELFHFTVTTAGTYRLQVDWTDDSDVDVYITDPGANAAYLARETTANPEVGTVDLAPGDYGVYLYMWASDLQPSNLPITTYRVRLTLVP